MNSRAKHIVIGITGASGSIYAESLIEKLASLSLEQNIEIKAIFTETGKKVYKHERGDIKLNKDIEIFNNSDFFAPVASGSSCADAMVIIPCSMGTLGRIASGTSDNLICRTADVVLKERKKLIIVPRETPLNLIHIKNMEIVTLAGGIILPASPSFYMKPKSINDLIESVTNRIIDLLEIKVDYKRWK